MSENVFEGGKRREGKGRQRERGGGKEKRPQEQQQGDILHMNWESRCADCNATNKSGAQSQGFQEIGNEKGQILFKKGQILDFTK